LNVFSVYEGGYGVYVHNDGKAMVTNAGGNYGGVWVDDAAAWVLGNVSSEEGEGVVIDGYGKVIVDGVITAGGNYIVFSGEPKASNEFVLESSKEGYREYNNLESDGASYVWVKINPDEKGSGIGGGGGTGGPATVIGPDDNPQGNNSNNNGNNNGNNSNDNNNGNNNGNNGGADGGSNADDNDGSQDGSSSRTWLWLLPLLCLAVLVVVAIANWSKIKKILGQ